MIPLRIALLLGLVTSLSGASAVQANTAARTNLVAAMLSEDADEQAALLKQIRDPGDPFLVQALGAWRGGSAYVLEEEEQRIPFIAAGEEDADGNIQGIAVLTQEVLKDSEGEPRLFASFELVPLDADSALRRRIKTAMDLFAIDHPEAKVRRDTITGLGRERNLEYLKYFEARLQAETDAEVRRALIEGMAMTRLGSEDASTRVEAIRELGSLRSVNSLSLLKEMAENPTEYDPATNEALGRSIRLIETYIWWGNLFGTGFRGLSLAAVLLVAALGLAITFGLMGIINMAHGEMMMVGAYATFVTQNFFLRWFGMNSTAFEGYFIVALLISFVAAGGVGVALERGIIRFLYHRPLESLLATWGVSLVLQQVFRHTFGAANVQVSSPSWLSGSFVVNDVLLAYNRVFVIGFAALIVLGTFLLLTRTSMGLQIRAVMQNRSMASSLGVRTDRVNMLTFGFGSGLAGVAGACLSQIGNVGPSLGQSYIVDCFMVVVLGGVGSLVGTISAALGVGVADQVLQPWLGAVMGKVTVLVCIILFLQWRPAGLFATRTRNLEG